LAFFGWQAYMPKQGSVEGRSKTIAHQAAGLKEAFAQEDEAKEAKPKKAPPSAPLDHKALQKRQEELDRREQSLKALEKELDAKLTRMQELEARLGRIIEKADALKDKKLKHLVDVYSNMKAKQAAEVLQTLDEKIAVKILAGMRGRTAGEILTFVNAEKAARLSEALTKMQSPFQ
ncbi:MAG: hypothetical protein SVS15_01325, partial [Thermodesulfobacteriota bacterium]|nr:hypothetical protein [Thermodesulfobacteriota bacterium]